LAKALGTCWVRVSGTWATRTYYDFDGTGMPEGYNNHLRKEQWINLLNFVKAVGGKLKISVANCDGLHSHDEPCGEVPMGWGSVEEFEALMTEYARIPGTFCYGWPIKAKGGWRGPRYGKFD
jgi:hypothetical protein